MSGMTMSKSTAQAQSGLIATEAGSLLKKVAVKSGGMIIIFAIQMLLCRLMGMPQFGHFAVITTVSGLLITFAMLGFESVLQVFWNKYAGRPELQKGLVRFSGRTIFLLSLACSVGAFVVLLSNSRKFQTDFNESMLWTILLLPFAAMVKYYDTLQRKLKGKTSAIPVTVSLPFFTLVGSLYYYYEFHNITVNVVIMCAFISSFVMFFIFRSRVKKLMAEHNEVNSKYEIRKWSVYSGQFFSADLLNFLVANGAILIVSYFSSNIQAGYFFITLKLSALLTISSGIVTAGCMPALYEQFTGKRKTHFSKELQNGIFRILSIALPAALILALSGKYILALFHPKVANETWLLLILIAAQILNSISTLNGKALTVIGKRNVYLGLLAGTLTLLIVLGAVLTPMYKLTGISIAVFASAVVFYFGSSVALRKSF